jgi:hypothetical protein
MFLQNRFIEQLPITMTEIKSEKIKENKKYNKYGKHLSIFPEF